MKTPLRVFYGLMTALLAALIFSCEHLAVVADVGAQVAAATGVIDQNTADAISVSSKAMGSAAEEITPEQEYYIGRAVGANILTTYKTYTDDSALLAYVNKICAAITVNSDKPDIYNGYHVMLLDSAEINAFATSGGHIFITRGLVAAAKSEEALAGVIAHEIAHIQLQHSIRAIKNNRITQAIMITAVSGTSAAAGYNVNEMTDVFNESVGEIVTTLVSNGYSRQQEFDADAKALELLSLAGYKPSGLVDMLRELEKVQTDNSGFGKTHPSPASRITNANKTVDTYKKEDTSADRVARFRSAVGGGSW